MYKRQLHDFFQFVVLDGEGALGELREIKMPLAVIDVIAKPPSYGLHIGVPGIGCLVAVAVVAGHFQYLVDIGRYGVFSGNIIGTVVGFIALGPDKLSEQEYSSESEEDFKDHVGEILSDEL